MNNKNFTAQEITTLQKTTGEVFKEIINAINNVKDACSSLSGIVASGDSNLSGAWNSISDSISTPVATAEGSFNYIGDLLGQFVQQTVSNEQTAESDLGSIEGEIGALGQVASGLVNLGAGVAGTVATAGAAGVAAAGGSVADAVKNGVSVEGGVAGTVKDGVSVAPHPVPSGVVNVDPAPPSTNIGGGPSTPGQPGGIGHGVSIGEGHSTPGQPGGIGHSIGGGSGNGGQGVTIGHGVGGPSTPGQPGGVVVHGGGGHTVPSSPGDPGCFTPSSELFPTTSEIVNNLMDK